MRTGWAESTISSPSAASAAAEIPKSPGPRWKPAPPSPGNIPAACLKGENSIGEFYSVAVANNYQQADTGTKMIHIGRNTKSTIVSKGISAGHAENTYRGLVKILPSAAGARNFTQCDSLLMGAKCAAHTFPYMEVKNATRHRRARGEHLENRRGSAVLLPAARHFRRRRGQYDRQRLLQSRVQGAADGIRGGSSKFIEREFGRRRRLTDGIEGNMLLKFQN